MPDALALALGVALGLAAAVLLGRRAPAVGAGLGLVLLLVAVLRGLSDAAGLLAADPFVRGLDTVVVVGLLGAGLVAGTSAHVAGERRPVLARPGALVAVVLAHVPLLTAYGAGSLDVPDDLHLTGAPGSSAVVVLLAGLLAGGAVASLRPRRVEAAVAAVALTALVAVHPLADALDAAAVRGLVAAASLAVLAPRLLAEAGRREPAPAVGRGVLAGVVLVLGCACTQALLDGSGAGMPRRYTHYVGADPATPGLQEPAAPEPGAPSSAYASSLTLTVDGAVPALVPSFGLLDRSTTTVVRIAG